MGNNMQNNHFKYFDLLELREAYADDLPSIINDHVSAGNAVLASALSG